MDSISTSDSTSAKRMAAVAPGFRAMLSQADAIAMAKPGVISTQFVDEPALPSAANATGARRQIARATNRKVADFFIELLLSYEMAARRWLPDTPRAAGITLGSRSSRINAPRPPPR